MPKNVNFSPIENKKGEFGNIQIRLFVYCLSD